MNTVTWPRECQQVKMVNDALHGFTRLSVTDLLKILKVVFKCLRHSTKMRRGARLFEYCKGYSQQQASSWRQSFMWPENTWKTV